MIRDMLPASVKKMIRRKSLQYSIDQDEPTTEQYIYRRHVVGLDLGWDKWTYNLEHHTFLLFLVTHTVM